MPPKKSDDPHFRLRVPASLKAAIEIAAEENNRSINAEIVSQLERYPSLGGEVDAMWEVARALADEIDKVSGPEFANKPLFDQINDAFDEVETFSGAVDRGKIARKFSAAAAERLSAPAGSAPAQVVNDVRKLSRILDDLRYQITLERASSIKLWDLEPHILEEAVASNEVLAILADSGELQDKTVRESIERAFAHPSGTKRVEALQKLIKLLKDRRAIDRGMAEAASIVEPLRQHISQKRKGAK